ncbi:bifunctional UDP-N-acetylglucosamine diphosphorylase/glucosamine-1-phosphate N-acetyltransferase GlmU [bacterium]|nr:bifunctional UDP-N-acetylglucosamine diphosphorylase/glucosamine-1-phosphate N-acetyltransferase GlmU [bacterium]
MIEIVEEKNASETQRQIRLVNTGVLCAQSEALRSWVAQLDCNNAQGEYLLTDIFRLAHAEGKSASSVICEPAWRAFGANDAAQLAELESRLRLDAAQNLLKSGVRLSDPMRIDVRGALHCGHDVEIDINVIFEGENRLASNVRVGPFTRLKNCDLAEGTIILSHCDLEGVSTTGPCQIGPFARLRPGTVLARGVKIGNFVETKAAQIGENSKVSHLSYIGDATLGAEVNIGAGTITCNYDGVNKHQTMVDDYAFIGSNTSLVAPVRVEQGATIGAGTVLTRDAPAKQLTLTRSPQKTISTWKRPQKKTP